MARTPSNMLPLGTLAPDFKLKDTNSNNEYSSFEDFKGSKGTLVIFMCNHCPFVLHVIKEIVMIANDYRVQGLGVIAISSNDIEKFPQDSPELMTEFAFENKIDFPYLFDESQEVAKAFDAACTPDFYLFDNQNKLFYRGQLDLCASINKSHCEHYKYICGFYAVVFFKKKATCCCIYFT